MNRSFVFLVVGMGLMLLACNRIPLTPPAVGEPSFSFQIQRQDGSVTADESTGEWTFAVDTTLEYVNYSTTYTSFDTGEVWELVFHRLDTSSEASWEEGLVAHRLQQNDQVSGSMGVPYGWADWADWTINDEPVNVESGGSLNWTATEFGELVISSSLEDFSGNWNDPIEQQIDIELRGLIGCDLVMIPGIFGVEPGTNSWEEDWKFHPPTSQAGVTWKWIINEEDIEYTNGAEHLTLQPTQVGEEEVIDVRLIAEAEDNHPYGIFDVHYQLILPYSWYDDDDDDDDDDWQDLDELEPLFFSLDETNLNDWIELRHRDSGGNWLSSTLLCDEEELAQWKFEIFGVLPPAHNSAYSDEERIEFSCQLPLRNENQWQGAIQTVQLSGIWPVMALD